MRDGEKRDPHQQTVFFFGFFFFPLLFCSLCCDQLLTMKVEEGSQFPQSGDITSLICIDMQMSWVTVELSRPLISIGVCVCAPSTCAYLLQYLGHCFCVPCLMDMYCI